ncbi:MAG: alpha/beta fold hydrolase [Microbacteriaceae bacterium]|nr:alpha/beta fold hydrolase [Microbacteriaceae bacterium]
MTEIRSTTELPARRRDIELTTADGLILVGELSLPAQGNPVGTLVFLHPLPTGGGYMDSHIIRKAALRLPAMANVAVLRFNFRGVTSSRGTSQGVFGEGIDERFDLEAALNFVRTEGLPTPWLVGWSFGTEVALNHGHDLDVAGLILLAPPLHRTSVDALERWNKNSTPIVAVIPELDDYLKPAEARKRFAVVPRVDIVEVDEGRHLWVGEKQTFRVLSEIVERVNPAALPLPTTWP